MKTPRFYLAACALALLSAGAAQAQMKGDVALELPFDTRVTALPENFQGHSCDALSDKIPKADFQKDTFETSAEFERRIKALKATPLVGTVTLGSTLAFLSSQRIWFDDSNYNADTATLTLTVNFAETIPGGTVKQSTAALVMEGTEKVHEVKTNAQTGQPESTHLVNEVCAYAVKNAPRKPYIVKVHLAPAEAKKAEGDVFVVFVGKLAAPYKQPYSDEQFSSSLTIQQSGVVLLMEASEVWVINQATGQVLSKKKI